MSGHDETILRAAISILRDDGIERVKTAQTYDERALANAALLAAVNVENYLLRLEDEQRPF